MGASGLERRYTRTPHTLGRGQGKNTRLEVGPRNVGVQSSENSGQRGISHFWDGGGDTQAHSLSKGPGRKEGDEV